MPLPVLGRDPAGAWVGAARPPPRSPGPRCHPGSQKPCECGSRCRRPRPPEDGPGPRLGETLAGQSRDNAVPRVCPPLAALERGTRTASLSGSPGRPGCFSHSQLAWGAGAPAARSQGLRGPSAPARRRERVTLRDSSRAEDVADAVPALPPGQTQGRPASETSRCDVRAVCRTEGHAPLFRIQDDFPLKTARTRQKSFKKGSVSYPCPEALQCRCFTDACRGWYRLLPLHVGRG